MVVLLRPVAKMRDPLPDSKVQEYLFDPSFLPIDGIFSVLNPISLNPGEWRLIGGLRRDRRALRVREAHARYDSGGLPVDGSFRGSYTGQVEGANYFTVWAGRRTATSRVHIYSTNTGLFSEVTASSGKYGDTRFSDSDNHVHVAAVTDHRNGFEYLVFQNGVDSPRVYHPTSGLAIHQTISVPKSSQDLKTVLTMLAYLPVSGAVRPAYNNVTAAKFSLSDTGTSPNQSTLITVDSTWTTSADTGKATYAAGVDFSLSRQAIFVVETDVLNFMDSLKIEFSNDDATYYTVWDPTDATKKRTRSIEFDANVSREVFGFNIDAIAANLTSVRYVRYSWVGTAPAADITMKVHAILGSGRVRGRARHGIAYANTGSRAESYGITIPDAEPARIKDLGGPDMDGARLPNAHDLFYRYNVQYLNTSTTERDRGVDIVSVYRKDLGEAKYTLVAEETLASYGGVSWAYSSGTEFSVRSYSDDIDAHAKLWNQELPAPDHVCLPAGGAMIAANNRLFVGVGQVAGYSPGVYFSAKKHPFRFRAVGPYGDPDSGSSFLLTGQSVQAFASVATSTIGASTIYIFTEKMVAEINGLSTQNLLRWTKISTDGTKSPFSVAEHAGFVYYLDTGMHIRRIGSSTVDDLSRLTVHDRLTGIPASRRAWAAGHFYDERYYLAYTPSGQSANNRAIVYNEILGQVEADDSIPSPFTVDSWGTHFDSILKRNRLIGYSTSDGKVYEYEQPNATLDFATTKPVIELTPRELHYPDTDSFTVHRVGIHCEGDSGSTITVTRTYNRTGAVRTSAIGLTLPSGRSQIFAWDRQSANSGVPYGPSCQLALTGSMTGGKYIFGIVYEVARASGGGRDG